jgi:hypothetical protein
MRTLLLLAVGCCVAAQAAVAVAGPAATHRTIPCDEIIGVTAFPYRGSSDPRYQSRPVLGVVSAPAAHIPQTSPTQSRPWTHFSKWGMVVRAGGRPVTVTVPRAWRQRVGISWGNGGHGVFSSIRFNACGSDRTKGNAYAGGFFLRKRSGCVPLVFAAGSRRQTVWFGVGTRCN